MTLVNTDRALQMFMGSLIQVRSITHALGKVSEQWEKGKALKLLLAGYVGNRNTGADVRVEELVRQLRHILGDSSVDLTVMTLNKDLSVGYFRGAHQILLPQIFPQFLYKECSKYHGVIACEGSMFKSKFADALSTMMAGALGIANAERKISVGYGAEAGFMNPPMQRFVQKHCQQSFVICRNEPSREILEKLGIRTASGTDTAWTFSPSPGDRGVRLLRELGWDGHTKILMICPINPFWWPVKPSLWKAGIHALGNVYEEEHFSSVYFHDYSDKAKQQFARYLQNLVLAVEVFMREQSVFPVLVAMEKLDERACVEMGKALSKPAPILSSHKYNMWDMISMLRQASMMLSSRFHAIVTTMPGGVPSAGVTMDERIRNLMTDRGQPHLFLEVDDENLCDRILDILRLLHREADKIQHEIYQSLPKQFQLLGQMGIDFMDEVTRIYPSFPRRDLPRSWDAYLPELPKQVSDVLEKYS